MSGWSTEPNGLSDHEWQEEILHFWFGGDQQVNYHTKWFPDGGGDVQARTDREINERFGSVFQGALRGDFTDSWTQSPRSTLALIVVLDQFSRHIFRLEERPTDYEGRRAADNAALSLAQNLQSNHEATVSSWPMAMMVFALMPFRHNASIDRLEFVLQQLQERETRDNQGTELMLRFRKQTVRRLQHLQDRARVRTSSPVAGAVTALTAVIALVALVCISWKPPTISWNLSHSKRTRAPSHSTDLSRRRSSSFDVIGPRCRINAPSYYHPRQPHPSMKMLQQPVRNHWPRSVEASRWWPTC